MQNKRSCISIQWVQNRAPWPLASALIALTSRSMAAQCKILYFIAAAYLNFSSWKKRFLVVFIELVVSCALRVSYLEI
jgi:hypothetical protein